VDEEKFGDKKVIKEWENWKSKGRKESKGYKILY